MIVLALELMEAFELAGFNFVVVDLLKAVPISADAGEHYSHVDFIFF